MLFERGEYVSFANCGLPYYIGEVIPNRSSLLVQTVQGLKARFNIDIKIRHEVVTIHPNKKIVVVKDLSAGVTFEQAYDNLIYSPGAKPIRPPVPGIDEAFACGNTFTLRSIPDTDAIKAKCDALIGVAKDTGALPSAVVVGEPR